MHLPPKATVSWWLLLWGGGASVHDTIEHSETSGGGEGDAAGSESGGGAGGEGDGDGAACEPAAPRRPSSPDCPSPFAMGRSVGVASVQAQEIPYDRPSPPP